MLKGFEGHFSNYHSLASSSIALHGSRLVEESYRICVEIHLLTRIDRNKTSFVGAQPFT